MGFWHRTRNKVRDPYNTFRNRRKIKNAKNIAEKFDVINKIELREKININKENFNVSLFGNEMFSEDEQIRKISSKYNEKYTIAQLAGKMVHADAVMENNFTALKGSFKSALKNVQLFAAKTGKNALAASGRRLQGYNKGSKYERRLREATESLEKKIKEINLETREMILKNNGERQEYEKIKAIINEQIELVKKYEETLNKQNKGVGEIIKSIEDLNKYDEDMLKIEKEKLENIEQEEKLNARNA